ncbi:unnamed protein product [Ostreobium quekettii]|uniref:Uncharacterized protein n=1 Tax=Ostreobium quekettii TaxID=121088 RepID=A0A8S1IPV9_9CHLO|nr:unnamed protein product [Ostreobium quekettii]|eukprot:evm.model.scf_60.2 EVM.evm.TU.scf_60.2   scf_60:12653-14438(-)
MCHGSEGTAEENTTFVTVIKCMGHWTEAGGNYSAYEPVGATASCSGAVHQKTLACVDVDEQPVFLATEYGCALNFSYEVVNNGEARNSSTVCQGVESVTEISSASPPDGDVTKENLQSMLEDVLPDGDSSNAPDSPDDQNVVDLQSLLDLGDVAITCNGQDTSLLAPCHGTLQIAVEGPKANTTESCKGWWFPVPAPGLIFACTGEWAVDASSAAGAEAQDCMGHTVLETRVSLAHGHHFRGARELCIGSSRRWGLAKAEHHWDDAPVAST